MNCAGARAPQLGSANDAEHGSTVVIVAVVVVGVDEVVVVCSAVALTYCRPLGRYAVTLGRLVTRG